MHMNDELERLARNQTVSYFGVSNLSKLEHSIIDQAGTDIGEYPYCITMGIVLPNEIVNRLPYREQYSNAFNYKLFAYDVINQRLDLVASVLTGCIQDRGYRALPIPASGTVDHDRICGAFSHKLGARLCGFGWIGKSCLLITPQNGPRVRWVSVLTDAPLEPTGEGVFRLSDICRESSCVRNVSICLPPRKETIKRITKLM